LLVVGGDTGMPGAARMACEAALRIGAGRVSLATRVDHAASISAACPPLMAYGVDNPEGLDSQLDKIDVIAIGPGLGTGIWGLWMLGRVLDTGKPLVIDADGLNLLAREPTFSPHWVLTPHPGEAARLLGISIGEIERDRYAAAIAIQQRYGGSCVLKGAGTLVQSDQRCAVCAAGNPGMATAGMGDVLTGVIAGLMSQGMKPEDAAELGVELHARAGDEAAREGERGMIATDLLPLLRRLCNPVQDHD
jgi:NAD(P)H-hydrate epimerase